MSSNNANGWLLVAGCLSAASVIAWVDFGLYISHLPEDGMGIALNAVIAIVFTFMAAGFYVQWNKRRRKPEK